MLSPCDFVQTADHLLPSSLARWAAEIAGASLMKQLDPLVLSAVLWQEGSGNPRALSFDGQHGKGLGQIDDRTWGAFCRAEWLPNQPLVFEPDFNALAAARILRSNLNELGEIWLAVAAYNAGPGTIRKAVRALPLAASFQERFAAANAVTWNGDYLTHIKNHFEVFTAKALELQRQRGPSRV